MVFFFNDDLILSVSVFQARFLPDQCATGIELSDDNMVATKTRPRGYDTIVLLTRPAPDALGSFTTTWRLNSDRFLSLGYALPDMDPNLYWAVVTHGSFVNSQGRLGGLGTKFTGVFPGQLPGGKLAYGSTLSLRYDPLQGTMHARVNSDDEVLCFTDLRDDLVPAVCLVDRGASCTIVDE
jgi:hypothetical protein